MLGLNLNTNQDLDSVFRSAGGFLYVQGFHRDNVVQRIQEGVGPLPQLGWVADPNAATPITGISQPFVGALLVRNLAEVQPLLHLAPRSLTMKMVSTAVAPMPHSAGSLEEEQRTKLGVAAHLLRVDGVVEGTGRVRRHGVGPRAVRQRRWRHLHDRRWRVWVCLSLVHLFLGKLLFAIILFAGLLFARLFFALLVGSRLCSRMKGRLEISKCRVVRQGPPMRADLDCLAVVHHGARLRHGTKLQAARARRALQRRLLQRLLAIALRCHPAAS